MRRKKRIIAFTLAETLIALVIIGIVASLTIPSVVINYQKHQTEVKVKKAYSMLNNALNMAQAEYGDKKTWGTWDHGCCNYGYGNGPWGNKYLFPFLKGQKNPKYVAHNANQLNAGHAFITSDGIGIDAFGGSDYAIITFDINGDKKPNKYGKDVFSTYYYKDLRGGGFKSVHWVSWTAPFKTILDAISGCVDTNFPFSTACLDAIMLNNWKIPKDYPW